MGRVAHRTYSEICSHQAQTEYIIRVRPMVGGSVRLVLFLSGEFQKWYPLIDARCQHRSREPWLCHPPDSNDPF